ncbi:DUF1648 domain-containing protein [Streptomyces sp. SID10853]|uniref:DUF1648 domain-containing protein n=1 Tax=Streptomyces sp. SID10853 TaxID=2706028 RepID=UPI001EF1E310|nr:DUF1648 domain-containing protein [Streptomyces sp. SID10853]
MRETMGHGRIRRATVAGLPFLLAYVVDLVVFIRLRDRLPYRLASHFGSSGRPDDTAGHLEYVLVTTALLIGLGVLWMLIARGVRSLIVMGWVLAGIVGALMAEVLYANLHTPAVFPFWRVAIGAGVGAVAGGAGWWTARFAPSLPAPPAEGPVERIDLGAGETAGWARHAGARPLLVLTVAVVVTGAVLLAVSGWQDAVGPVAVGLVLMVFARPYVTVDRRGLTVSTGRLPWPRIRVPLGEIEQATSRDINALKDFGGWGYRVRAGRSGLILRSGEAIVVRRRNGRDFAVTIDGSADAAALLNTLAERQATR